MRKRHLILFTICLLCCSSFFAQSVGEKERIVSQSNEAFSMAFDDPDKALQKSSALVSDAVRVNDAVVLAHAQNSYGWAFFQLGKLDSALKYLQEAKIIFTKKGLPKEVIQVSLNLSEVYSRRSDFKRALAELIEGEKFNIGIQNIALQNDLHRQFAIVYREMNETEKSLDYFQKAIEGFKKQNDYFRYTNTAISMSILYRRLGRWQESLLLLEELSALKNDNKLSPYQEAMLAENKGETYFEMKDDASALKHFMLAYELFGAMGFTADMAYESMNVGKVYKRLNNYHEAESYLRQAYHLSDSLLLTNYAFESANELALLYAAQNNWKDAYLYLQHTNALQDSLNLQQELLHTKELKEKYENEKNEQEILLLKSQNELKDLTSKRKNAWLYFLITLSGASIVIVWLLSNKMRLNKKLEYERNQNRVAGEIEEERIINQFAISLFGKNTMEDILWDVAQNCINVLHFEDSVIYLADPKRNMLVQYAAAGPKKRADNRAIYNPIEIPANKGIVGYVYTTGQPVLLPDTRNDERYIVDDAPRLSELAIPIMVNGEVFGVIDSEHPEQNFYTDRHLRLLQRVAHLCSERIVKLLNEEKLRLNIARDLHDEVGSTITSIHILSKLALNNDVAPRTGYLEKIHDQSTRIMSSMNDIIWAINPKHDTFEETIYKMKEMAVDLVESAGMNCIFKTELIPNYRSISPEERKYIFLIFKEAVNNAVKYSGGTEVSIHISHRDSWFEVSISDNGRGFDKHIVKTGNGLKNMQDRAASIGAEWHLHSSEGEGTTITIRKHTSHT